MKLQLYVLRLLILAFTIALGGISFLVFPGLAVSAVHKLQGAGLYTLLTFMPMLGVELVPYLLPLAFLLAVVATFGRLAANNEWTAIRMAGINPARLLVPGLVLALALAGLTAWVVHELSPNWKYNQRSFAVRIGVRDLNSLSSGKTEIQVGDFYLNAQRRRDNTFYDVLVYLPQSIGGGSAGGSYDRDVKVAADAATFEFTEQGLDVTFVKPRVVKGGDGVQFDLASIQLSNELLFQARSRPRDAAKYYSTSTLLDALGLEQPSTPWSEGPMIERERREVSYEIHRRNALAATYFLFLFLGLPTGIWLRRGSQLAAFTAAVGYAFVYYVFSLRLGKELFNDGHVGPEVGAWITNAVGVLIGLAMTWKVLRR